MKKTEHHMFSQHSKKLKFGILVLSLTFTLFGAEVFLSQLRYTEKPITKFRHIRLKEHPVSTVSYVSRRDGSVQREFRLEVDSNGYIHPSRIHEEPDTIVLFLGGSTTACAFVDEESRFPYLVGRLLERCGEKVNSYNSGVGGNNSMHSNNILLNKGLALNPDVVVMMHNINDLQLLLCEEEYWNDNPTRSLVVVNDAAYLAKETVRSIIPRMYKLVSTTKLGLRGAVKKVEDEFGHVRGKRILVRKQRITESFESSLRTFIAICTSNGTIPVLMTQANRFKEKPDRVIRNEWHLDEDFGISYETYREIYNALNDSIRKVGESQSVMVIDLARRIPQDSTHLYDAVHLNDNGSKYVAGLIAQELAKHISATGNRNMCRGE